MTKITIELDYDTVDDIVYNALKETRYVFKSDLGTNNNVFVLGDPEADDVEIQKYIDALDLLLDWYRVPGKD